MTFKARPETDWSVVQIAPEPEIIGYTLSLEEILKHATAA